MSTKHAIKHLHLMTENWTKTANWTTTPTAARPRVRTPRRRVPADWDDLPLPLQHALTTVVRSIAEKDVKKA